MSIWRDMPPLTALRAFSAFADAGTLAAAGAQTGVTHAAISQQIRALEAHLRVALVVRSARGLVLTGEGRDLARGLADGFGSISATLRALTADEGARPLRVTTTPAFAGGWLMPRLADFRRHHPGVDLMIDPTADIVPIGPEGADLALRFGNGSWPGLDARLLLRSSVVVVAAPALMAGRRADCVADLAGLPWLEELGTSEATAFLEKYGLTRQGGHGLTSMPGNLVLDAARDGQGLAVIARAFVEGDLAAGRLVVVHEDSEREGYFIVTRPGVLRPAVKAFVAWAVRAAAHATNAPALT
jgi:LysR family transcriptional regulator, glycine cleavage system transcriptional activator